MPIQKDLLIFTTAGNVDDGKSTLTGRLIYDCRGFYADQIAAVTEDGGLNLAHFSDGLKREQTEGITIDVSHRYFESSRRRFILRDAPGHLQFTRNLVTAASTAQAMVLVVDASRPPAPQTARHLLVALLLQLRVIVCVNKMDLVQWKAEAFENIKRLLSEKAANAATSLTSKMTFVPTSALQGDFVAKKSKNMSWYRGPTLLEALETGRPKSVEGKAATLPVQAVNADGSITGELTQGRLGIDDLVQVLPAGHRTKIRRVLVHGRDKERAGPGVPVRIYLDDGAATSRGDLIVEACSRVSQKEFQASIFWLHPEKSIHNRDYILRTWTRTSTGKIEARTVYDTETARAEKKNFFENNDVGTATITLSEALPLNSYAESGETGSMLFIDPQTNDVVAAALIL